MIIQEVNRIVASFCVIINLLVPLLHAKHPGYCPFYTHYYFWDNCNACGLCTSSEYKKCSYLMDKYYKPESEDKCELVDHCETGGKAKCQGTSCLNMFGSFKCNCGLDKYGKLCQYPAKDGEKYAVIKDILTRPIISPEFPAVISILFSSTGTALEVHLKTLFENLRYDSQLIEKITSVKKFCDKWYIHFSNVCNEHRFKGVVSVLNIQLVYGRRSTTHAEREEINDEENHYIGYIEKVSLTIYNNKDYQNAVFESDYKLYTIYQSPTLRVCFPHLSLRNVGNTMERTIKASRKAQFVIVTSYHFGSKPECQLGDNVNIHWTLWKLNSNHNPLDLESVALNEFKSTSLDFEPYSLEVGQYKIRCNISVWYGTIQGYDFTHGYFEIFGQPIEAIISGGSDRTAYHGLERLVLDGKLSSDPNLPPGKKQNLLFFWKCDQAEAACKGTYSEGSEMTYKGPFKKDTVYTYSLTVFSGKLSGTTTQKIKMIPDPVPTLMIRCKKNCGVANYLTNPTEIVYFEVVIDGSLPLGVVKNDEFTWTFRKGDKGDFRPVDEIKQADTPQSVLIVLQNKLTEGDTYTFQVTGGANRPGETSMEIKIASKPKPPLCWVNPKNNTIEKGKPYVDLYCSQTRYNDLPVSPIFNIYDKFPHEVGKGRLVCSSKSPASPKFSLTRGTIVVSVKNHYGLSSFTEYPKKLVSEGSYEDLILSQIDDLEKNITTADEVHRATTIATITELIANEDITSLKGKKISEVIENMLEKISQHIEANYYTIVKVWTETVKSLAVQGDKFGLTVRSVKAMGVIVDKLAKQMLYTIKLNNNDNKDISSHNIREMSESMLGICDAIYLSKNEELDKQPPDKGDLHEYLSSYENITVNLLTALDNIMLSLSMRAVPYQDPIEMKSGSISLWAKEDSPQRFYLMSSTEKGKGALPGVSVSRELANSLSRAFKYLSFQIITFNGNPFWWDQRLQIDTNVVDLKVRYRQGLQMNEVSRVQYPIEV